MIAIPLEEGRGCVYYIVIHVLAVMCAVQLKIL